MAYQLKPSVILRKEFDNEGVLFDTETGKIFSLNTTALLVCQALPTCETPEDILKAVGEKMNLPPAADAEIRAFIQSLIDKQLVIAH